VFDLGVIFRAIKSAGNLPAASVTHTANQAVTPRHFPLIDVQQVDSLQSNFGSKDAKLFQRDVLIAPARRRLTDLSLALNRRGLLRRGKMRECGHCGSRNSGFEQVSTR